MNTYSKQQELELFNKYKGGDKQAKIDLVQSLTPIVMMQSNKWAASGLPKAYIELEAKRLVGEAIDTYDPTMSQLNTHVINYLKKLSRSVMNYQNVGHIPENRTLIIGKYNTVYDNLEDKKGRPPTVVELSDSMNVSIGEIERLQLEQRKDLSMSELQDSDDAGGFYFYARNEDVDPVLKQAIQFVYFDADPVDKKIMEHTFGLSGMPRMTAKNLRSKLGLKAGDMKRRQNNIAKEIKGLI